MPALESSVVIGIDVSKATLEVCLLPDELTFQVANDADGWRQLVARLPETQPGTIVLEATGSYHRGVTLALGGVGHPPAVINPRRTHAVMVSDGMRATTDRSDARMLARFGQQTQPPPSPVDSENARTLTDLVGCRDDLIKRRVMARTRLTVVGAPVRDVHEATIAVLSAQLADVDARIAARIAAAATRRSAPGIGPVVSAVLLARLAELGQRHAKPLAALAGVAPHAQDSGTKHGPPRGHHGAVPDGADRGSQHPRHQGPLSRPAATHAPHTGGDRLCPQDARDAQSDAA